MWSRSKYSKTFDLEGFNDRKERNFRKQGLNEFDVFMRDGDVKRKPDQIKQDTKNLMIEAYEALLT